ncbi:protein of unknown function [Methylocaldum szegediense]|uniref:Uncharacterized protein n=1 Tax=Methylocaldum szegediense TaxID=73780 RepID=A0ABM9I2Z7_9GAMM|nr:protein of unknown function [Methylocaldum szegediense]
MRGGDIAGVINTEALCVAEGQIWRGVNLKSRGFLQLARINLHAEAWAVHKGVAHHEHDRTRIQPGSSVLP